MEGCLIFRNDSIMQLEVVNPGRKRIKYLITKLMFFILAQTIQSASRFDPLIKEELKSWPEDFKVLMKVKENGPSLSVVNEKGMLKRKRVNETEADILISVKNIEFAFRMITMRAGTIQAFMENRSTYFGDVPMALSLIRILNVVQFYLLPRLIAGRVIKRLPKIKWPRRYYGRIRLYLIGIPLGR